MSSCDSHNSPCFAARAVTWLRHRHQNWPAKAVAREIGEAVPTVESWWAGKALPSTRKLAALFTRYPAMVPFVMQPWLDQDFLRAQRKLEEARKIIDEVMTWEAKR